MNVSRKHTLYRWWPSLWVALVLLLGGCAGDGTSTVQQASDSGTELGTTTAAASAAPETASPVDQMDETSTATADEPATTTAADGGMQEQSDAGSDGISYNEQAGGGGGKNIVQLRNFTDGRLRVRGNIQLNRIPGPRVEPVNVALGYASCTDCQTLAIALQINLISRTANVVTPQNAAVALNAECTRCYTVARAIQYVYSVDDPTQVPREVSELIRALDRELKAVHADPGIDVEAAEARIDAVIAQFKQLAEQMNDQRDSTTDPNRTEATPVGTIFPTTTAGLTATAATPEGATATVAVAQPAGTATPTPAPTTAPTSTASPEPTATVAEDQVAEPTPTP